MITKNTSPKISLAKIAYKLRRRTKKKQIVINRILFFIRLNQFFQQKKGIIFLILSGGMSFDMHRVNLSYLLSSYKVLVSTKRERWSEFFLPIRKPGFRWRGRFYSMSNKLIRIFNKYFNLRLKLVKRKKKRRIQTITLNCLKFGTLRNITSMVTRRCFHFQKKLSLLQRTYYSKQLQKSFLKRLYFKPYFNDFDKNFFFEKGDYNSLKSDSHSFFWATFKFFLPASPKSYSRYYFFNGNKSPLEAMRNARLGYAFFLKKKTLRNVQYKVYLKQDIKCNYKLAYTNSSISTILKAYNFTLGWYQTRLLISSGFALLNATELVTKDKCLRPFDVISFRRLKGIYTFLQLYKQKSFKRVKRLKRQGYLLHLLYTKRWMRRKKNSLSLTRWSKTYHESVNSSFVFDFATNSGILLSQFLSSNSYTNPRSPRHSSLVKLYTFKFRAS